MVAGIDALAGTARIAKVAPKIAEGSITASKVPEVSAEPKSAETAKLTAPQALAGGIEAGIGNAHATIGHLSELNTDLANNADTSTSPEDKTDTLLTPETLKTPKGLTVEIKDRQEAQAVADQLNNLRAFLSGDQEAGKKIDPADDSPVASAEKALGQLSELSVLHLSEVEFAQVQAYYERSGWSPDEAKQKTLWERYLAAQRTANMLAGGTRATDLFRHTIHNEVLGRIVSTDAVQPKTKQLAGGHNFVNTGGVVGKRELTAEERRSDSDGNHSMLVHTYLDEDVTTTGRDGIEFFFPAGEIIEQTPWITLGPREANAGRVDRKTAVKIAVTEEYLSTLPEPGSTRRDGHDDTAFMADIEDPNKAGDYEFGLDTAVVMVGEEFGLSILRREVKEKPEKTIFSDRAVEKYLSGTNTIMLETAIQETMIDIKQGIGFDDMEFTSEQGRQLFVRLVEETNVALVDIGAAYGSGDISEASSTEMRTVAARTAIMRTLFQEIGAPTEWTRSRVFLATKFTDPKVQEAYSRSIKKVATGDLDSDTFYIGSRHGRLGFGQRALTRSAVDKYEQALAA